MSEDCNPNQNYTRQNYTAGYRANYRNETMKEVGVGREKDGYQAKGGMLEA